MPQQITSPGNSVMSCDRRLTNFAAKRTEAVEALSAHPLREVRVLVQNVGPVTSFMQV
jgi:hypothetical protein